MKMWKESLLGRFIGRDSLVIYVQNPGS